MNLIPFILFVLLVMGGCSVFQKAPPPALPTAKAGQSSPLATAANTADNTAKKDDEAQRVRNAKIKVSVTVARTENQNNPDGPSKTIVDEELGLAEVHLSDVEVDPAEFAKAVQRRSLVTLGKAPEARKAYDAAKDDAEKLIDQLVGLRVERDQARAAEKAAVKTFEQSLEQNRIANQKAMDRLNAQLEEEKKSFLRKVGYALTGVAILLVLAGGFLIYTGVQSGAPFKAVVKAVACFVVAGVLIGLAVVINQPWFIPAVLIGTGIAVLAIAAYVWSEYREAKERKVLDQDATIAEKTLTKVASVIDQIPDKEKMEALLARHMNDDEKALILELRALAKKRTA